MPCLIGQGLWAWQNEKILWGLNLAPNHPPLLGKVKIWMLWRFRKIYHCKCQNPPPTGESKDLDVMGYLENFTIASIRAPPPQRKWKFGCFGRFRKFYHCKYQNPFSSTTGNFISEHVWIWEKQAHKSISRGYCGTHLMHTRCQYEDGAVVGGHWLMKQWLK